MGTFVGDECSCEEDLQGAVFSPAEMRCPPESNPAACSGSRRSRRPKTTRASGRNLPPPRGRRTPFGSTISGRGGAPGSVRPVIRSGCARGVGSLRAALRSRSEARRVPVRRRQCRCCARGGLSGHAGCREGSFSGRSRFFRRDSIRRGLFRIAAFRRCLDDDGRYPLRLRAVENLEIRGRRHDDVVSSIAASHRHLERHAMGTGKSRVVRKEKDARLVSALPRSVVCHATTITQIPKCSRS